MKPKTYPLNQSPFYKLQSKKKLATLLQASYDDLKKIQKSPLTFYKEFDIPKEDNKRRHVTTPEYSLKKIQKRVLKLLQKIALPEWVIAGVPGKSYITNAQIHRNAKFILKIDIRKFYDNCTRDRVYRLFKDKFKTSSDVAELLTDLITTNSIPTGSPTSQLLAFLAYQEMFENIYAHSRDFDCTMTLYVDDMVFSSRKLFKHQTLVDRVRVTARKFSHQLKDSKTQFKSTKKGVIVTGVHIRDGQLSIPNHLRKKTINRFKQVKEIDSCDINSLRGLVGAAKMIEPNHFNGVASYLKQIN